MIIIFGGFAAFIVLMFYVAFYMLIGCAYLLFWLLFLMVFLTMGSVALLTGLVRGLWRGFRTRTLEGFWSGLGSGWAAIITFGRNSGKVATAAAPKGPRDWTQKSR